MLKQTAFVATLALATIATTVHADATVLINGATQGRYNAGLGDFGNDAWMNDATQNGNGGSLRMFPRLNVTQGDPNATFASAPNFTGAGAGITTALGNWLTTPGTPGGSWTGTQAIPATWTVNTETAIIYALNSSFGLDNVVASIGVDNGVFVWVDGVYMFGATAPGGAGVGEYNVALGDLSAGTHYLQILRADHGGGTGWNITVNGEVLTSGPSGAPDVPVPATLALLGTMLAGLGWARRRA